MEKKGLGKGLGALIPGADREVTINSTNEIDLDRITFNPYQPRGSFTDEKFQELVSSIRVHGVLQPILVRSKGGGDFELVAGERRMRAAKAAGLSRVPAVVREMTNQQSLQVALIENIQREDISALDSAIAYRRLIDEFNLSQEDIAFGLGKSRSSVANTLRLLSLPAQVRQHLAEGRITEGHARAILGVDGESRQIQLAEKVIKSGLTVRDTERMAREWSKMDIAQETGEIDNVSRETIPAPKDPNILALESHLRSVYGTKVTIVQNKDRGKIEIEFYTPDDLDRIISLLGCE